MTLLGTFLASLPVAAVIFLLVTWGWSRRRKPAPKPPATITLVGLPTTDTVPGAYLQVEFAAPARTADLTEHAVPCVFPTACGRCDPLEVRGQRASLSSRSARAPRGASSPCETSSPRGGASA